MTAPVLPATDCTGAAEAAAEVNPDTSEVESVTAPVLPATDCTGAPAMAAAWAAAIDAGRSTRTLWSSVLVTALPVTPTMTASASSSEAIRLCMASASMPVSSMY